MIMRCIRCGEMAQTNIKLWTEVHISMSLKEREHAGTQLLPGPKVIKLMRSFQKQSLQLANGFSKAKSKKDVRRP